MQKENRLNLENRVPGKKGQLTLFIIMGAIVLVAVMIYFFLLRTPGVVSQDVAGLTPYIDTCIQDTLVNGVNLLSVQGGHIVLPEYYMVTDYGAVSYVYKDKENLLVTLEGMQNELAGYIEDTLEVCFGNFTSFAEQGWSFEKGSVSAKATITRDRVIADVSYPLQFNRDNDLVKFNNFRSEVVINLYDAHQTVDAIIAKTVSDPDFIDLTFLSEFNGKVDVIPEDEDFVYTVTYDTGAEPYVFIAAFSVPVNEAPIVEFSDMELVDGQDYSFNVSVSDPEGDSFVCSDDTAMFDITDDCRIDFVPEIPGHYNVTIFAEDSIGNIGSKEVEIRII